MNKRMIAITAGLALLVIGVMTAVFVHQKPLTAHLSIQFAPTSSAITVNGQNSRSGSLNVRPGSYKIVVSHSGFVEKSTSVTVAAGETKYVGFVLASNSPATANWYVDHADDQRLSEIITGKNISVDSTSQQTTLPIIKELPFIDNYYRIDYGVSKLHPSDPNAVALYVKYYSDEGKQQALDWLKFKGYDPAKLEIIYINAGS